MIKYFALYLSIIALVALVSPTSSLAKELSLFDGKSVVRLHSKMKLSGKTKQAYKTEFRKNEYYAAFAASPVGVFFFMGQFNDIKSAYRDTLRMCRALLTPGESDCVIYASIIPSDYKENNNITLSKPTTDFYLYYKKQPGHKAFAINPHYSNLTRDYDTKREAISRALLLCNTKAKAKTPRSIKVKKCEIVSAE